MPDTPPQQQQINNVAQPAYAESIGSAFFKILITVVGAVIVLSMTLIVQYAGSISDKVSVIKETTSVIQAEASASRRENERRFIDLENRTGSLEREVFKR